MINQLDDSVMAAKSLEQINLVEIIGDGFRV